MRAFSVLALALLAACSSYEYRDTNAAVDANPLCMSRPSQPGEPVSRDCERTTSGAWSTKRDSQPVDFKRPPDER
ncbi:hypothetical protein CMZ84_06890 [Lysobacteraceae bacterium NML93-0399]|nr:hypothetical protein CMZ84_06890 [Xanthomonadaceae bacterium NML93-0399]